MGADFFSFFRILSERVFGMRSGPLASDEIQLLVFIAISLSCAIVGTFLMLRKMTLLANSLSHTILLGIVITYLIAPASEAVCFGLFLVAALITGWTTAFCTEGLKKFARLQEDASIGLIFSLFFATAVLLISIYMRNTHVGLELIMGNADALVVSDIRLVWGIFLVNGCLGIWLFRGMQLTTFDPIMARAVGFSPLLYTYILMSQTALTTIGAFRCIGVFMVLALLVVPPMIVRLFVHSLKKMMCMTAALSVAIVMIGVAFSRHLLTMYGLGISTGGIVVTFLLLAFIFGAGFIKYMNAYHRKIGNNCT